MCSVSATIDSWRDGWQPYVPSPMPSQPFAPIVYTEPGPIIDQVQRAVLKKEIAEFREILRRARKWDAEHQTEPCTETADKIEALREIVRALGLEDEVEVVLKELEENDDNAVTHVTLNGGVTWEALGGFGGGTSGSTGGHGGG